MTNLHFFVTFYVYRSKNELHIGIVFVFAAQLHKHPHWHLSHDVTILHFISLRLLNAELEAKTADIVRQAEQLMVNVNMFTKLATTLILFCF